MPPRTTLPRVHQFQDGEAIEQLETVAELLAGNGNGAGANGAEEVDAVAELPPDEENRI